MAKSSVIFGVRNTRINALYDRNQLRLGSIVYVKFSNSGEPIEFSPVPAEEAIRFAVSWIAPSEWYVSLVERYDPPSNMVENIKLYCGDYIDVKEISQAVSNLVAQVRIEHLYKTSELGNNFLWKIGAVIERLNLCHRLQGPTVEEALEYHLRPLRIYLHLTCFDLLGQPTDWLDFGSWLSSDRHEEERHLAMLSFPTGLSAEDICKAMFSFYVERYGVKSGFFRFIDNVLPKEQRDILLDSIKIQKIENPPNLGDHPEGNEKEKLSYLFKIRNEYTHRAQFVPGVGHGMMPPMAAGTWIMYQQEFGAKHWETIFVKQWPEILEHSVCIGLAEGLRKIANQGM